MATTFDYLNVGGVWFSGVSVLVVSCVSLYLAHPIQRLRLQVNVDGGGASHHGKITVRNVGRRPVIITAIDWSIGTRRNRQCFGAVDFTEKSTSTHYQVLPDNEILINFSGGGGIFLDRLRELSKTRNLKTLRIRIHASGQQFREFYPGDDFIEAAGAAFLPER